MRLICFFFCLLLISCGGGYKNKPKVFDDTSPHAYIVISPVSTADSNKIFELNNSDTIFIKLDMLLRSDSIIRRTLKNVAHSDQYEVMEIKERIQISAYENNGLLNVKFFHNDEEFAVNFLNTLSKFSIEAETELKSGKEKKYLNKLKAQLDSLYRKQKLSEEKMYLAKKNKLPEADIIQLTKEFEKVEKLYLLLLEKITELSIMQVGYHPASEIMEEARYKK